MEREIAVLACNAKNCIPGARRHPRFRLHTSGDDPRATRNFERKHALIGKKDIAFKTAALVLSANEIYQAKNLNMLVPGNEGTHRDDIVELQMRIWIDATHHSSGVELSVPSTMPTARLFWSVIIAP